jgi:hypothetical protein
MIHDAHACLVNKPGKVGLRTENVRERKLEEIANGDAKKFISALSHNEPVNVRARATVRISSVG